MTAVRIFVALAVALAASRADAQSTPADAAPEPPRVVAEGALGWAGFGDEGIIHHTLAGAGVRVSLTPRISVGPEVQYMSGPGSDRDLVLTGNIVVDVLAPTAAKPRRTTPYAVVGGGLFRHANDFAGRTFSSTEGGFTAGIGVRTWFNERVFAAADARLGWEPHVRLAATLGVVLR